MYKYKNREFNSLIQPIVENEEFLKTKNIKHHGLTRYDHSRRVAYFSYLVTKFLRLDYKETTEAALVHDFFTDEVKEKNGLARLRQHPTCAVENAKKYFELSDKQEDIIKTHMFPVTFTPPKYLESWIVDLVDDAASIYERATTMKDSIKTAASFIFVFIINYIKMH